MTKGDLAKHVGGILDAKGRIEGGVAALLDILENEVGTNHERLTEVVVRGLADIRMHAESLYEGLDEGPSVKIERS